MFVFQVVESCESGFDFWTTGLTQSGEQRLFLVSRMFWRRLVEVLQGRSQRPPGLFRRRAVDRRSNGLKHGEKRLDPPVTVRQQASGVSKVMRLGSNLNRHSFTCTGGTGLNRIAELYLLSPFRIHALDADCDGGRPMKVASRLMANIVTAVISVMADAGSHDHAQVAYPW